MDAVTRNRIADALEMLASQSEWSDEVWQRCYDLVLANIEDELVSNVLDDVIHCSATPIRIFNFGKPAEHPMFESYKQDFRDVAAALRAGLSMKQYKDNYE